MRLSGVGLPCLALRTRSYSINHHQKEDTLQTNSQRFLSLTQVAERYGLSYMTVWNMAKKGRIPAFRIGGNGAWRVDLSALQDLERRWASGSS